ncbi:hypothetical protein [Antribacter gilvus]|uniref:hypothetical protein n=1 Tax=Antribacter gilvus TaxID=2304675 RepID=UPI000F7A741B|nr:hypothetical protein [Antribacter gilvus]
MSWSEIAFWALAVAVVVVFLAWRSASRLDRLHRKVAASRIALDTQLVRRASAAVDLAASGVLDPASAVLVAETAYAVVDAAGASGEVMSDPSDGGPGALRAPSALVLATFGIDGLGAVRERAESALSATLREALGPPEAIHALRAVDPGDLLLDSLAAAWYRATLARRFHNEAVAQAQRVRRHWYVRLFHLAGRAPVPRTVELDDAMPDGLDPVPATNGR